MAALVRGSLLVRLARRGFRMRSFSLDEVVAAIEVRGELKALAARLVAERGLKTPYAARMEACIARAKVLLATEIAETPQRRAGYEIDRTFHDILIDASRVRPLAAAYAQVNLVPLAAPSDTIFNLAEPELSLQQLMTAQEDHVRVLQTLADRHSTRAAALMRKHAYRSGERASNVTMTDEAIARGSWFRSTKRLRGTISAASRDAATRPSARIQSCRGRGAGWRKKIAPTTKEKRLRLTAAAQTQPAA